MCLECNDVKFLLGGFENKKIAWKSNVNNQWAIETISGWWNSIFVNCNGLKY